MPVLDTPRLHLRPVSPADAQFMLALLNDPDFVRFVGDRGVRTLDDARRYLDDRVLPGCRAGAGLLAVEDKRARGTAMGVCGLVRRPELDPDLDIGYAFLPAFRGQGYAKESAHAVLAHARDTLCLPRLLAIVAPDHDRSIRVLRGLGMTLRERRRLGSDGAEVCLFAIDFGDDARA